MVDGAQPTVVRNPDQLGPVLSQPGQPQRDVATPPPDSQRPVEVLPEPRKIASRTFFVARNADNRYEVKVSFTFKDKTIVTLLSRFDTLKEASAVLPKIAHAFASKEKPSIEVTLGGDGLLETVIKYSYGNHSLGKIGLPAAEELASSVNQIREGLTADLDSAGIRQARILNKLNIETREGWIFVHGVKIMACPPDGEAKLVENIQEAFKTLADGKAAEFSVSFSDNFDALVLYLNGKQVREIKIASDAFETETANIKGWINNLDMIPEFKMGRNKGIDADILRLSRKAALLKTMDIKLDPEGRFVAARGKKIIPFPLSNALSVAVSIRKALAYANSGERPVISLTLSEDLKNVGLTLNGFEVFGKPVAEVDDVSNFMSSAISMKEAIDNSFISIKLEELQPIVSSVKRYEIKIIPEGKRFAVYVLGKLILTDDKMSLASAVGMNIARALSKAKEGQAQKVEASFASSSDQINFELYLSINGVHVRNVSLDRMEELKIWLDNLGSALGVKPDYHGIEEARKIRDAGVADAKILFGDFIVPVSGSFGSPWGMRMDPISGARRLHTGQDIRAAKGTTVRAAAGGTVVKVETNWKSGMGPYGNYVVIDHGNGYFTLYGHLSSVTDSKGNTIEKGDSLIRGAVIGQVGSTGRSTGPHLHFGMFKGHYSEGTSVNPRTGHA